MVKFLVHNVVSTRKPLVQPELEIAWRSSWVVLAGTKKIEGKLCSSEKLEFIIPFLHQVGLLAVDPFLVSILVAQGSCPAAGVGHILLELLLL